MGKIIVGVTLAKNLDYELFFSSPFLLKPMVRHHQERREFSSGLTSFRSPISPFALFLPFLARHGRFLPPENKRTSHCPRRAFPLFFSRQYMYLSFQLVLAFGCLLYLSANGVGVVCRAFFFFVAHVRSVWHFYRVLFFWCVILLCGIADHIIVSSWG